MCSIKFFVILSLALFATSVTAQKDKALMCLESPAMTEQASKVSKCYEDMFNTVLLNNSSLSCKSFSDFNNSYTSFYKDAKKCFNNTNTELTEAEKTFLNMVKALRDFDKLIETQCLVAIMPQIQECRQQNLTERNNTETWLRRANVNISVSIYFVIITFFIRRSGV
ncbi:hypothetical protein O3G_MSEX014050 [Manduca sexta]|uniref:Uncharacterized protein n=2 Tax=Manduca sexta TaxID=7130 RepID=A0A922CXT2_MANSE|nr:hypothetical protein O3G_MSEX014050 [Manduca sexta]